MGFGEIMSEKEISKLKRKAVELVFPRRCPFCRSLISGDMLFCSRCAKELPGTAYSRYAIGGVPCAAALPYMDRYAQAMKRYKIGKKVDYSNTFAFLTVKAAKIYFPDESFDFVTCVPMSEAEKRKRGFNHAETLAVKCSELLGLPYVNALEKCKENNPQHTMKRSQREDNVRGVFRATDKSLCNGKTVLLIDDIITTGNTLGECVRVLKRSGCKAVFCAVTFTTIV